MSAQLASDHPVVNSADGWQNVTLQSRIYSNAHSKLHNRSEETSDQRYSYSYFNDFLSFSLKLLSEAKSSNQKISAKSISEVIDSLGDNYLRSEPTLSSEKDTCHDCKGLSSLVKEAENELKSIATIPMTISYLKLIDRVRSSGVGATKDDIVQLLKTYKKKKEVISSLLDILAGIVSLVIVFIVDHFLIGQVLEPSTQSPLHLST